MSFLSTTFTSPQVASNSSRNKVMLQPGHSLMDWVRFKAKLVPTIPRKITPEELAQHNKTDDAWTAIHGGVYDITAYIAYHPGGVEELMKGAGIDSTELFNKVHRWVNFQNMLKECLIGFLVSPVVPSLQKPVINSLPLSSNSTQFKVPAMSSKSTIKFSYDSYQTERCFTNIVYAKISNGVKFRSTSYFGFVNNDLLKCYFMCQNKQYCLHIKFHNVCCKANIRRSALKIEIMIHKKQEELWPNEGVHQTLSQKISDKLVFLTFNATCKDICLLTHDTHLITFEYSDDFYAIPSIGSHIFVQNPDKEHVVNTKPYTIFNVVNNKTFQLLVKKYSDGIMSTYISSLKPGDEIFAYGFDHWFDMNKILDYRKVVMLAAGTGITPLYRILYELSENNLFQNCECDLMFYNKSQIDILINKELNEFTKSNICKISVSHILSEEQWEGLTGRIQPDHLERFHKNCTYLICGPKLFMELAVELLYKKGVHSNNIIEFKG